MQRIIIVQDDPYLIESRKLLLQKSGYVVDTVYTVAEARRRCREFDCDLVIVDAEQKHDTAMELCEEIKQNNPTIAVALMTGYHVFLHSDCPDEVIRQEEGSGGICHQSYQSLMVKKAAEGA